MSEMNARGSNTAPESSIVCARALVLSAVLLGCSGAQAPLEQVGEQAAAVVGDFSTTSVSVTTQGGSPGARVAQRLANGPNKDWVVSHYRGPGDLRWETQSYYTPGSIQSTERPVRWYREAGASASTLLHDATDSSKVKELRNAFPLTSVFPTQISAPNGPVSALQLRGGSAAVFGRFGAMIVRSAFPPGGSVYQDTTLAINATIYAPNGSPLAVRRSATTDSVWYSCGPEDGARVCEYRLGGSAGDPQNGVTSSTDFATDLGLLPANIRFISGTRPTALSTPGPSGLYSDRWVFAATVDNGSGAKRIVAKRDTLAAGSTAAPVYAGFMLESKLEYSYSTPMPYVRADGTMAVVYFRNDATTGSTTSTKVVQSAFVGGAWTTPAVIHDVGVRLPAGYEPTPYVDDLTVVDGVKYKRNAVLLRLPFADGARDTVLLTQPTDTRGFVKNLLPAATRSVALVAQSADRLYAVDPSSGNATQLGSADWAGTTALTSDRYGLGYAVQGSSLWEVNLNDGQRRALASSGFDAVSLLTFGYEKGVPTPYGVGFGHLGVVDLASGLASDRGPGYSAATALAHTGGKQLNAVVGGSLWKVNAETGAQTVIGQPGEWPSGTQLTSNGLGSLYAQHPTLGTFSVDRDTGAWTPLSAAANLVTAPVNFESSSWLKSRISVATDTLIAPDNTITADILHETTSNGVHSVARVVAGDPTKDYTFSVYAKRGGRRYLDLYLTTPDETSSGAEVIADLQTGTLFSAGSWGTAIITAYKVQAAGNDWYKVTVSGKPRSSAGSQVRAVAYLMSSATVSSYAGDGISGIYLWGGELRRSTAMSTPNLSSDTAAFESVFWAKSRLSISETNSTTTPAPDGTLSAEKLSETSATGSHCIYQDRYGRDPQRNYTWSVNIKPNGRTAVHVMLDSVYDSTSAVTGRFSLTGSGALFSGSASGSGSYVSSSIQALSGGWYRVSVTGNPTARSGDQMYVELCSIPDVMAPLSYTGDASQGFYLWGAQLRGNVDATLTPPLKSLVELPLNCLANSSSCWGGLYGALPTGQLIKMGTVVPGTGAVLDYQVLPGSTWPGGVLLAPRHY